MPREADELVSSRSSLGLLPKLGGASAPPFFSIRDNARGAGGAEPDAAGLWRMDDRSGSDAMQAKHHEITGLVTTAVLAVVVALVGLGGAIRLAQSAADLGPQVGDILTFEPTHKISYDNPPQVFADRSGLSQCLLDIDVMHRFGGSLIIEARSAFPNRVYSVHWAGRHSSKGPSDCGASAELKLTQDNLDILALAVGGYGVSHQKLAANALWQSGGSARAQR